MARTVRETIKEIVFSHLKKKRFKVYGQCLSAVGWVGGTLPELYEKDGMIELSMADVAGGGIVVGAALAGDRPIYVIRYQGFNWFNCPIILNYACKSKEIWKIPCPIFIRGIAMEGGIGPVAGSSHHSLYHRMPGVKIASPMTPNEYKKVYNEFMKDDSVYYISEHRGSYGNKEEIKDIYNKNPDVTFFSISITRFEAIKAAELLKKEKINVNIHNILWLKPFNIKKKWIQSINKSKISFIFDDDYSDGIASTLAYKLMSKSNKKVVPYGLKDKSAGFSKERDNLPPSATEIVRLVKKYFNN
tara:strand:+ start:2824 stop:3729 length:906 start_codon:yes stop_codon:yes gene_type:complete